MELIDLLKPKPLDPYTIPTHETKMFYNVSDALHKLGVHGDDNTIETCRILGIKDCCDKNQEI